ncbi:MAG TPA: BPSS1780 family membrane protein [Rubrivivax sp.]|nr:BPSS1780 family membrane protein [Rubrivivax sp.]
MALSIRHAAAAEGVQWVRDGFRLFARRPLPFTSMFLAFLLAALLATLVPVVGGVLMLMSLPLLSLGFMLGSRAARNDSPVHPALFVEPLRGERQRRQALLTLCGAYALCTVLIMTLSEWIDGGSFERLQRLMAQGDEARAELDAVLADPRLGWGMVTRFGLAAGLSVPFWHAPALVYWQGQSVGQSLFSSTLAVWRCKGAFAMYSLAWVVVIGVFGALVGLLFALFDARQLAGLIAMPAGLMFSTVFYVSLLFTYEGCFTVGDAPRALPAAAA